MNSPPRQDEPLDLPLSDFLEWCGSPAISPEVGPLYGLPIVVVNLIGSTKARLGGKTTRDALAALPCILVGKAEDSRCVAPPIASLFDIVLTCEDATDDLACVATGGRIRDHVLKLARSVQANPVAAISLALLLRQSDGRGLLAGLVAESTTYSMLQGGSEFRRWRAKTVRRDVDDLGETRVKVLRIGSALTIEFTRPRRHNAFDAAMRDAFNEALRQADHSSCDRIILSGQGTSFCSGGDLDEFGSSSDPAEAHLVRVAANPSLRLARLASKLEANLHGACIGSGLEMASFAHKVIADESAYFVLPEVAMGLIPGAGGTVSICNRIGRRRTAYLAISGTTIDAKTALEWGLIDVLKPSLHSDERSTTT
jgi:enoyl-CoA hydratase/carnithine racemase